MTLNLSPIELPLYLQIKQDISFLDLKVTQCWIVCELVISILGISVKSIDKYMSTHNTYLCTDRIYIVQSKVIYVKKPQMYKDTYEIIYFLKKTYGLGIQLQFQHQFFHFPKDLDG